MSEQMVERLAQALRSGRWSSFDELWTDCQIYVKQPYLYKGEFRQIMDMIRDYCLLDVEKAKEIYQQALERAGIEETEEKVVESSPKFRGDEEQSRESGEEGGEAGEDAGDVIKKLDRILELLEDIVDCLRKVSKDIGSLARPRMYSSTWYSRGMQRRYRSYQYRKKQLRGQGYKDQQVRYSYRRQGNYQAETRKKPYYSKEGFSRGGGGK